jgi:hypothetical protein
MSFRLRRTLLTAIVLAWIAAPPAAAQGRGAGENEILGTAEGARALTPFEQFADKLKLDSKTQLPAAREILTAAAKDASPVAVQLLQIRQRLLNVALNGNPQELKPVQDSYAAAAAKMAGIEAAAFAKVYATLKPNQQSNAVQAFAVMAGMFQVVAPAGGRGQRQGGQ